MKKSEVVKALRCCSENMCQVEKCPYYKFRCGENDNCLEKMAKDALTFISNLEYEISVQEYLLKDMINELIIRREIADKDVLVIVDYAVEKIREARDGS